VGWRNSRRSKRTRELQTNKQGRCEREKVFGLSGDQVINLKVEMNK
jgi:hypothetical protein